MSAFNQTFAHHNVSDRYQHINTEEVTKQLIDKHGFVLESIQESGVRKESNQGFQKHLVTLKYEPLKTPEGVPTVLITNSHNRSTGFQLHSGYIRFACSNGLVAGTNIDTMKIKHTNQSWDILLEEFVNGYMKNVRLMEEEHKYLARNNWTHIQTRHFLEEASKLRYELSDVLDINELNLVRRVEDIGNDGYKIYNRVQESLINGLFTRRTKRATDDGIVIDNWSQAKKLTDQKEIIRVNKQLRDLALDCA